MRYKNEPSPRVSELVREMDWRSQLDQCLCPVYERVPEGGAFSFGGVFLNPGNRATVEAQIAEIKEGDGLPPFLVADMEMGAGNVLWGETEFPSMRAAGKAGDPGLSRIAGLAAASAGHSVGGLNWTLAPCVDLCACTDSPMVSIRSAGEDVDSVLQTVRAYLKGLHEGGCMGTAKHFPGDGYSDYDQHLTTVVNPLSAEDWWRGPGQIYRELINDGLLSIMPGHIAAPAFDEPDSVTGLYPPATLSPALLSGLLREELKFEGLIVSDAIEMGGMIGYMNYYDACEAFLNAGGDVLLFVIPDERFYHEMEVRLKRGSLSMERLQDAATRVMAMKEHMGLLSEGLPPRVTVSREEADNAAREMARKAIQLVRDRTRILPLDPDPEARVLHVVLDQGHRPRGDFFSELTDALGARFKYVEQWDDPGCERLFQTARDNQYDLILCSVMVAPNYGVGSVRLHGPMARTMMGGWMRFDVPVIFLSLGHPYLHMEYEASMDTVVNTNGLTRHCISPLMEAVFGKSNLYQNDRYRMSKPFL